MLKQGVVLITGTTSGVGLNTLKPLITSGWKVVAINRSNKRAFEEASKFLTQDDLNKLSFSKDITDNDLAKKSFVEKFLSSIKAKMYSNK